MRKLIRSAILVAAFGVGFVTYEFLPFKAALVSKTEQQIKTAAFYAQKQDNFWILSLNPQHYNQVKSVAVTYRDTFYGVYLLADKIYLPVLTPDDAELLLVSLDQDGNPVSTESFRIGEKYVSDTSKALGH